MSFFSLLFFGGPEKGRLGFVGSEMCRLVLLNISCCKIKLTKSSSSIYMASLKINTPLSSCLHMSYSTSLVRLISLKASVMRFRSCRRLAGGPCLLTPCLTVPYRYKSNGERSGLLAGQSI